MYTILYFHANREDFDQTAQMCSLITVVTICTSSMPKEPVFCRIAQIVRVYWIRTIRKGNNIVFCIDIYHIVYFGIKSINFHDEVSYALKIIQIFLFFCSTIFLFYFDSFFKFDNFEIISAHFCLSYI